MINLLKDPSGLLHFKLYLKGKVCISNLGRRLSDVENLYPSNSILIMGLQCQCQHLQAKSSSYPLLHLEQNPNASEFFTCISLHFSIQPQFTLGISASSYCAF